MSPVGSSFVRYLPDDAHFFCALCDVNGGHVTDLKDLAEGHVNSTKCRLGTRAEVLDAEWEVTI